MGVANYEFVDQMCRNIDFWAVIGVVIAATVLLILCYFLCLRRGGRPNCCACSTEAFEGEERQISIVGETDAKGMITDAEKGLAKKSGTLEPAELNSDQERLIGSEELTRILEE